jgi:hypothetical protein
MALEAMALLLLVLKVVPLVAAEDSARQYVLHKMDNSLRNNWTKTQPRGSTAFGGHSEADTTSLHRETGKGIHPGTTSTTVAQHAITDIQVKLLVVSAHM